MELTYLNPTHTLIVAHLDAGEELGTLTEGTNYIKVDGTDPNYLALLEKDPQLESVVDPGEVRMPPPAEAPTPPAEEPASGKPHPDHPEHPNKPGPAAAAPAKPAAPAAHAPAKK